MLNLNMTVKIWNFTICEINEKPVEKLICHMSSHKRRGYRSKHLLSQIIVKFWYQDFNDPILQKIMEK